MAYKVVLSKNAKVNGKYHKTGDTVEVTDKLFDELKERELVESHQKAQTRNTKAKAEEKAGE